MPELVLAVAAVVYGVALVRMIRDSMEKFKGSDEMKNKQIIACNKTATIFMFFSGTFLLQAVIDTIAGVAPKLYYSSFKIVEGVPPVAPFDLSHALCSVIVNIIIISIVVKYEEVRV